MKFIYNSNELRRFHSLLKPLEGDEVYFISASARNKYLTPEEREAFNLGRTEMMRRQVITKPDFEDYLRAVQNYEVESGISGRGYKTLPQKCLLLYANINNSSTKKALQGFYQKSMGMLFEGGGREGPASFRNIHSHLMNEIQKARSEKTWIDIDTDVKEHKREGLNLVLEFCDTYLDDVEHHVIATCSGFHLLLRRDDINFNFHPAIKNLDIQVKMLSLGYESVINDNSMVPIPGTLAAGFTVEFVKSFVPNRSILNT